MSELSTKFPFPIGGYTEADVRRNSDRQYFGDCLALVVKDKICQLFVEDDEIWHAKELTFHIHWLPDLVRQASRAVETLYDK